MRKNLLKKTLVLGIIILFIGAIVVPSISGNIGILSDITSVENKDINNYIQNKEIKTHTKSTVDWWPMFRHDSGNSACSESVAPNTNRLGWKESISDEIYLSAPVIYNDRLIISTGGGYYLDMFEPPNIMEEFQFEIPDFTEILDDLFTYHDEYDGGIYCLDADTGTKLWEYSLYEPNIPLIIDNKIYVTDLNISTDSSSLYCLNIETGDLIWEKPVGGVVLSPIIGADGKIFLGCIDDYYYYFSSSLKCFDYDGNILWEYPLLNEIMFSCTPAYDDGKVYFTTTDLYSYFMGKLYCVNAEDGSGIWSQLIYTFFIWQPSPVCKDGKVFVVDFNLFSYITNLKCFDAETGIQLWQYTLGGASLSFGTPAVSEDSVFVAAAEFYTYLSYLYRISINGTLVWKTVVPGYAYYFSSGSPICSANKVFMLPWEYYGYASRIYCLEIKNGNGLWSYSLDYETIAYPSIADEKVFIADILGNIYAFEDALKINKVSGGILCAKAEIKNIGMTDLTDVSWSIDVNGGMFDIIDKHAEGDISTLQDNSSKTVKVFPVFGLGNIEIEVEVSMTGVTPIRKSLNGMVLGLIVMMKS